MSIYTKISNEEKLTRFINKANIKYSNYYDYSEFEYFSNITLSTIICPIHGRFQLSTQRHLTGDEECQRCKLNKRNEMLSEERLRNFIIRANKKYNNFYDYSKAIYITSHVKLEIICPIHGSFWKEPTEHILGRGCGKCGKLQAGKTQAYSLEEFLDKLFTKFPDMPYTHQKSVYINTHTQFIVTCPIHGDFLILPFHHLRGSGCAKCAFDKLRSNIDQFIKSANEIHDGKYGYIRSNYILSRVKIEIICPIHGSFWQRPNDHLTGYGCPMCNESKGEIAIRKVLKENALTFKGQYKFDDCRNINPLPFDFVILNETETPIALIEFNGEQHYRPIDFSNHLTKDELEESFKLTQYKDKIKSDYCLKNNIPLLVIPYTEKKNIKEIVNQFISGLNITKEL